MRSSNAEQLAPSVSRLRCVVLEQGALPFLPGDAEDFDETVVVAQLADERPEVFAQRMLARLAWAARAGKIFGAATVVTGGSASLESLGSTLFGSPASFCSQCAGSSNAGMM